MEIDSIEIYANSNIEKKFKKIKVEDKYIRGFTRNFFISDFSNFYMYLNLFTLTGLFYCYYKQKNHETLNYTIKKVIIFDDDDFSQNEINNLSEIGLKFKFENEYIEYNNIQKLSQDNFNEILRENKEIKEKEEKLKKLENELNKSKLLENIGSDSYNVKVYLNEKQVDEDKKIILVLYNRNIEFERRYYKMDKNFLKTQTHVEEIHSDYGYSIKMIVKPKFFGLPIVYRCNNYNTTITVP